MLTRLGEIFRETCNKWECQLVEFNGEAEHVHLLVNFCPRVQISKLIANLKTVSSKLLRKEYPVELARIYSKPVFWSGSYFVASCGGVTIETLVKPKTVITGDLEAIECWRLSESTLRRTRY